MRKIRPFLLKKSHLWDCAGMGRQLTVLPDGDVSCCHVGGQRGKGIFANILKDRPESCRSTFQSATDEYFYSSPIFNDECHNCAALPICGGGCTLDSESRGLGPKVPNHACEHAKRWLQLLAGELINGIQ